MRQGSRGTAAVVGVAALVALTAGPASAQTTTQTPAPGSRAQATVAEVDTVVSVSRSRACASGSGASQPSDAPACPRDNSQSEATANALEISGNPPSAAFGGTSNNGEGEKKGQLFALPDGSPVQLRITPWRADSNVTDDQRTASSETAIIRLILATALELHVLESKASATHTSDQSTSRSETTGARLVLGNGQLRVVLLHAHAASSGDSESYVLGINDTKVLSSRQRPAICDLKVPNLLQLICLTATGGVAENLTKAEAEVAELQLASGRPRLAVVTADSQGGVVQAVQEPAPVPAAPPTGTLPRTGFGMAMWAAAGLLLVALGVALVGARRLLGGPAV